MSLSKVRGARAGISRLTDQAHWRGVLLAPTMDQDGNIAFHDCRGQDDIIADPVVAAVRGGVD